MENYHKIAAIVTLGFAAGYTLVHLILFLKSTLKKRKKKTLFNMGTKMVRTKSGTEVELYKDQPDGLAEAMVECMRTGKSFSGHTDDKGNFIKDE